MSDRRRALVEKFQALTRDRLTRMAVTLMELEQGQAGEAELERITRELHTLKGESRMLGFEKVSVVAHAVEGRLRRAAEAGAGGGALLNPESGVLLRRAVEAVRRAMSGGDADGELGAVVAALDHGEDARQPLVVTEADITATGEERARPSAERWVSVHGARIEELCEQITAFAAQFRGLQASIVAATATSAPVPGKRARSMPEGSLRGMLEGTDDCAALLRDVTDAAWSLRLAPVEPLLDEMSKHARELAIGLGKRVRVETVGAGVELERTIIDAVWEPILHLVRNAVSHGVEPPADRGDKPPDATLRFGADAAGASVILSVEDDGGGVDFDRVRRAAARRGLFSEAALAEADDDALSALLFTHGFSTLTEADDISGRGVGLDVVRRTIEALGGSVAIETARGRGTRFALTVPTTISKEHALVVDSDGVLHGFPCRSILEVVRLSDQAPAGEPRPTSLRFRGEEVALHSIRDLMAVGPVSGTPDRWAVVVEVAGRRMAFGVDAMLGERELLRRPVDELLARLDYVAASSTVDDGRVVIVFLIPGLMRRADAYERPEPGSVRPPPLPVPIPTPTPISRAAPRKRRVLLVDDSEIVCDLLAEMLISAGFDVAVAHGGKEALGILATRPIDVLLTDLDMPGMSGTELIIEVRAGRPDLPVVVLSARRAAVEAESLLATGADAYLEKSSFHKRTLVDTIERAFAARAVPA